MTYTSKEQSKALLHLGLDEKTADMYYQQTEDAIDNWEVHIGKKDAQNELPQVSCWSAEALLDVLPTYIYTEDSEEYSFDIDRMEDNYFIGYRETDKLDYDYLIVEKGELISVLFKVIEWLLNYKLI